MKKIISLILTIAMLMSVSALAWELDTSVFEETGNYNVKLDEFNGDLLITNLNRSAETFFLSEYEMYPQIQITPAVLRGDKGISPWMTLYMFYYGKEWLFFDHVYFKVDDTTYECKDFSVSTRDIKNNYVAEGGTRGLAMAQ